MENKKVKTVLFIDYDLVKWELANYSGLPPIPHLLAGKMSMDIRKNLGGQTELFYKKEQLDPHVINSFDRVILCSASEVVLDNWARELEVDDVIYLDSEVDWQIRECEFDNTLYVNFIEEMVNKRVSIDKLIWHSSASIIEINDDIDLINLDSIAEKSKNYLIIYDLFFFERERSIEILSFLEQKNRKVKLAYPIYLSDLSLEICQQLAPLKCLKRQVFFLTQKPRLEDKKKLLALSKYKKIRVSYYTPNFDTFSFKRSFYFLVELYDILKKIGVDVLVLKDENVGYSLSKEKRALMNTYISYCNRNITLPFDSFIYLSEDIKRKGKSEKILSYEDFLSESDEEIKEKLQTVYEQDFFKNEGRL